MTSASTSSIVRSPNAAKFAEARWAYSPGRATVAPRLSMPKLITVAASMCSRRWPLIGA